MDNFDHNMGSVDCGCEDERPNVTLQRLNLVRFPSLTSLASRSILANLERIPPEYITDILPWRLRLFLLEQLERLNSKYEKWNVDIYKSFEDEASYRKTFDSFDLLIGLVELTGVCLDWLIISSPQKENALCEVLSMLAQKSPNLQKLVIGRGSDREARVLFGGEPAYLNPLGGFGEPLMALRNLTSLTLNKVLWSEDLDRIGSSMPGLEFLECAHIKCQDSTNEVIEVISILKNLRHLIYHYVFVGEYDCDRFGLLCLEHFPRLETISRYSYLPLYKWGHIEIPVDCQLTRISICTTDEWFENLNSNPFLLLPNITQLRVIGKSEWSESELQSLSHQLEKLLTFERLHHLFLRSMTPHPRILQMFLNRYGRNLKKLGLEVDELSNVHQVLQQLIDLCPVLEELHLCFFSRQIEPPLMSAHPGKLSSLRTLHLEFFNSSSLESILLAAPSLQNLTFEGVQFTQAEGQRLSDLVRDQLICTKMTSFTVLCSNADEEGRKAICELTKDMIAFCPELVDVTFKFNDCLSFGDFPQLVAAIKEIKDCCLRKGLNFMDNYHSV